MVSNERLGIFGLTAERVAIFLIVARVDNTRSQMFGDAAMKARHTLYLL